MATAFLGICPAVPSAPLNPACREEEFVFFLSDLEAPALVLLDPFSELRDRRGVEDGHQAG